MGKFIRSSVTTIQTVLVLSMVLAGTLTTPIAAYASNSSNVGNTTAVAIPAAESVYQSESMKLPPSVGSFIILIVNEAHESWQDEKTLIAPRLLPQIRNKTCSCTGAGTL